MCGDISHLLNIVTYILKPNLNTYVIILCALGLMVYMYFRPDVSQIVSEKEREISALTDSIKLVRGERAALEDSVQNIRLIYAEVSHLRDSMANEVFKALAKYKGVKIETAKEREAFEKMTIDETSEYILKKIK